MIRKQANQIERTNTCTEEEEEEEEEETLLVNDTTYKIEILSLRNSSFELNC